MEDEYYPEGDTASPDVYIPEEPETPPVVYDHLGNPWVKKKIKMGFDLK